MLTTGFEFYTGRFEREYYLLGSRWKSLFSEVGRESNFLKEIVRKLKVSRGFGDLFFRYAGKGRFYHNPRHVLDCLLEFDEVKFLAENPLVLEAGLLGHDVIYDTKRNDNEVLSRDYMKKVSINLGAGLQFANLAGKIVLVTDHKTHVETVDEALAVDIDLSIFGKPEDVFDEYDKNIRKEYSWVSENDYRVGRRRVLGGFLQRDAIYYTDYFRNKYETKARFNLERAIDRL